MIASILMCDRCHRSTQAGALPALSGGASRLAANRGTIRRIRLGRLYWRSRDGEREGAGRPYSVDLCASCAHPTILAALRDEKAAYAERSGARWEPAR